MELVTFDTLLERIGDLQHDVLFYHSLCLWMGLVPRADCIVSLSDQICQALCALEDLIEAQPWNVANRFVVLHYTDNGVRVEPSRLKCLERLAGAYCVGQPWITEWLVVKELERQWLGEIRHYICTEVSLMRLVVGQCQYGDVSLYINSALVTARDDSDWEDVLFMACFDLWQNPHVGLRRGHEVVRGVMIRSQDIMPTIMMPRQVLVWYTDNDETDSP